MTKHPARFSKELCPVLVDALAWAMPDFDTGRTPLVLDPFAGTGTIHSIAEAAGWGSEGIELEPEWANMDVRTTVGSALALPWMDYHFDAILTSPTYGNRFADKHNAKDGSVRRSYTHDLGRKLTPGNSGGMQWGAEYREFHRSAWAESVRVLRPGGLFILNISDHIRQFERQPVSAFHIRTLCNLGLEVEDIDVVSTRRMRYGANSDSRPVAEFVITLRRPWI